MDMAQSSNHNARKGKRRIWLRILIILMVIGIVCEGSLMLAVYIAGARNWPREKADVAIVLGAMVMPDGELSTTLLHRTQKALELYREGEVSYIITCGAQGPDEPMTEALAMKNYLVSQGVDSARVFLDDESEDTIQNIRYAQELMKEHGFETATVVTSEYHLTRALWIAADEGLNAYGAPAKGPDTFEKQLEANIRETLSWINYFTGGWLRQILNFLKSMGLSR